MNGQDHPRRSKCAVPVLCSTCAGPGTDSQAASSRAISGTYSIRHPSARSAPPRGRAPHPDAIAASAGHPVGSVPHTAGKHTALDASHSQSGPRHRWAHIQYRTHVSDVRCYAQRIGILALPAMSAHRAISHRRAEKQCADTLSSGHTTSAIEV